MSPLCRGARDALCAPEKERTSGTPQRKTGLWATSDASAALLRGLSDRLDLGWQLNDPAPPRLLALTNLGGTDPADLALRCRPERMVLCLDDRAGRSFVSGGAFPCFTYSEGRNEADLTARDLRVRPEGLTFLAVTRSELARVCVPPGALYHALTALSCAAALGVSLSDAARELSALLGGRLPIETAGDL